MIYNIVIYFVLWGIAIASLFNEKVRKMWRGEREAFKILSRRWILTLSTFGFMLHRSVSLNRDDL